MNKEFIEALKAHVQGGIVLDEIDAFAAAWPSSEHNPENYPAHTGKIDTSPEALRLAAKRIDFLALGSSGIIGKIAELLDVVANEKEAKSRSQKMRDAGYTARDTRIECDECGGKYTPLMLPIHNCAPGKIGGGMDQSTGLDVYGMSPEEGAEFEQWCADDGLNISKEQDGFYLDRGVHRVAWVWAACAKLYREKLRDVERQRDDAKARLVDLTSLHAERRERVDAGVEALKQRIKELETRLEIDPRAQGYDGITCRDVTIKIQEGRIKELEAENIRAWGEYNNAQYEAGCKRVEHLGLIGRAVAAEQRVKELEADAARIDMLSRAGDVSIFMLHDQPGDGDMVCQTDIGEGQGSTLRAAIDAVMKGGG